MINVYPINGGQMPATLGTPQEDLIHLLERLLDEARSGQLQSFVGTGFMRDGFRVAIFAEDSNDVFPMMGAIAFLQSEFAKRHPD